MLNSVIFPFTLLHKDMLEWIHDIKQIPHSHHNAATNRVMMELAPFENTGQPGIKSRWSQVSKGHGLSESDIMGRQRYFENSR